MDIRYLGLAAAFVVPALLLTKAGQVYPCVQAQLMQLASSRAVQRLATFYTQSNGSKKLCKQASSKYSPFGRHSCTVPALSCSPVQPQSALPLSQVSSSTSIVIDRAAGAASVAHFVCTFQFVLYVERRVAYVECLLGGLVATGCRRVDVPGLACLLSGLMGDARLAASRQAHCTLLYCCPCPAVRKPPERTRWQQCQQQKQWKLFACRHCQTTTYGCCMNPRAARQQWWTPQRLNQ